MSLQMPEEKLEIIKLVTTQHIRFLNETEGKKLHQEKLTISQLLELLGFHRPEAGGEDAPPPQDPDDEVPEGWLCGADNVCGVNKATMVSDIEDII